MVLEPYDPNPEFLMIIFCTSLVTQRISQIQIPSADENLMTWIYGQQFYS